MSFSKPIFQDSSSIPIKFFIQKDLPQDVQSELCDTIVALGGRVESKVPRQGYILVQPGSPEAERLQICWKTDERPERFFVPYTYVEACKIAGKLIKQIFVEDGRPIPIHIHSSIANVNTRHSVSSRIVHAGGEPNVPIQIAKVILADPETEVFRDLVKTYQSVPDVHIESFLWVKKCIDKGALAYTPVIYKNPGGRRVGEERTAFTSEDEQNLCKWIAVKIPYKDSGGRTGNRLYQQLCELGDQPDFAWVTRHTWQSWRERYKKNADRLDKIIAEIVEETKPVLGEKGQYGYVRQDEEKKPRRSRKRKAAEGEGIDDLITKQDPNATADTTATLASQTGNGSNDSSHAYASILPPPAAPLDPSSVRKTPAEEEQDDDPEWAIRIGNDPPPAWSKLRTMPEDEFSRAVKRPRINGRADNSAESAPQHLSPEALVQIANMHVIDQTLQSIAQEFRFTMEEVKEYYDRCGDMTKTRARFDKMRKALNALGDD